MRTIKSIAAAVAVISLCAGADGFAASYPKIAKDTPYATARTTMAAAGFRGARNAKPEDCGPGREDVCQKWPEAQSCAGTGMAACLFVWKKGSTVVEIATIGEDDIVVNWVRCRSGC